jgi:hypothetical protein
MPIPLIIWGIIGVLALFFGWQFFQQLQQNWLIILIIALLVLIIILLV